MKLRLLLPPALITSLLALTVFAQGGVSPKTPADASCPTGTCLVIPPAALATAAPAAPAPSPADAALIAKARTSYPLKTCLVSDESLGSMGEAVPYIHRVAGQLDRVIFVCCEGCIEDFNKDPAKFLAKLAAAKTAPAAKS